MNRGLFCAAVVKSCRWLPSALVSLAGNAMGQYCKYDKKSEGIATDFLFNQALAYGLAHNRESIGKSHANIEAGSKKGGYSMLAWRLAIAWF